MWHSWNKIFLSTLKLQHTLVNLRLKSLKVDAEQWSVHARKHIWLRWRDFMKRKIREWVRVKLSGRRTCSSSGGGVHVENKDQKSFSLWCVCVTKNTLHRGNCALGEMDHFENNNKRSFSRLDFSSSILLCIMCIRAICSQLCAPPSCMRTKIHISHYYIARYISLSNYILSWLLRSIHSILCY